MTRKAQADKAAKSEKAEAKKTTKPAKSHTKPGVATSAAKAKEEDTIS